MQIELKTYLRYVRETKKHKAHLMEIETEFHQ
jgi:ribosomal protein S17